ncbi:3 beta-hydroxysteroid dehydrogenase/Delta 5--_4-isomerase [Candidatus Izimaplasma bacterium HR1]|jgi:nucleoside-diphosphate-sugar epimerase|uniref:NAD-dependent epimerase/dehydratase family protein n=1 Tax=Candidatus Izimoplasma sp. HR1 TaxID=1541959 RepID=UPI0004F7CF9D|nr:3 beta-hydroxysteroid dehydrogenase/Delta 5-->4-isomerase [Candidatus Izimaplasma bacterium HR1]
MRVLLTGPCGSVGIQTLSELVKKKEKLEIVIFEKQSELSEQTLEPFIDLVELHFGDLRDVNSLDQATKNIDFVIHTAAIIPPLADHNTELAYDVNVCGTKNLLSKIKEYSPKAFFLYTSSVSVYGDRLLHDGIKIGDELNPSVGDYYAHTKIEAEQLVINSGLDYSIFRLTGVMGPRPGDDPKRIEPLMFHMPLDTKLELVTTRDCGYALVEAIKHQNILNKNIYNLAGGKKCQVIYRDFIKHSFSISGINLDKFPKNTFAEQNFHCAYYEDSYILNDILHFQRDTLESYYDWIYKKPNPLQKAIVKLFQKAVIKSIAKSSDVLNAVKNNDKELIKRFLKMKFKKEVII